MNRKMFFVLLLLVVAGFMCSPAFAATKAHTINTASNVDSAVAIGDVSSGDTAEVDGDGNLAVENSASTIVREVGDGDAIVSGAFTLKGLYVTGITAGDYILVYDALTKTGDPVLDVYVGTAKSTVAVTLPSGGVSFSTGLSIDAVATTNEDNVTTTIIYES
jgi:hypothetical protein